MSIVTKCLDWDFNYNILESQKDELCMKFVNVISEHIINEIAGACHFYNEHAR